MNIEQVLSLCQLSIDDAESIKEIYEVLNSKYRIEFDLDTEFDFSEYQAFHANQVNDIGPVMNIIRNDLITQLCFVEVMSDAGKRGFNLSYQLWGVVKLKKKYSHILIKQETLLDKIHDRLNRIDIDFDDDKAFSKRFMVVSNDEQQARLLMTPFFRDEIKKIELKEIIIEIKDQIMIIGNEKPMSFENADAITTLMTGLAGKC